MNKLKKRMVVFLVIIAAYLAMSLGCMTMRSSDEESKKTFEKENVSIRFINKEILNRNMHYAITGADTLPTLFFIHGSPGSWSAFKKYLMDKDLLQHYRLISIDRPGFGNSNYGEALNITKQSEIIGTLIQQLQNKKPFYIIGHSLGGPICVKLGALYQPYINGIVLLAASVDPNEEAPEKWRPIMKTVFLRLLLPGAFRPSNDELWYFKKDVLTMPKDLNSITCPVVIVQGLIDPLVPPGNAFYAQQQLTHAQSVLLDTLPGANHFIPWTRYDIIKQVLLNLNK